MRGDGPTVYFAGESGYFAGFMEVGARFRPDVALLPISGYRPLALRRDHLSPLDAIYAFEDLGAQLMVPDPPRRLRPRLRAAGRAAHLAALAGASQRKLEERIAWLEPGESCVSRRAPLQTPSPSDMSGQ